jgi:hypothetical protein
MRLRRSQSATFLIASLAIASTHCAAQDNAQKATAPQSPAPAPARSDAADLSQQATDPTASLMAFNSSTTYTGGFHNDPPGQPDDSWELKFQPVIPFTAFGVNNILRVTVPYQLTGPGDGGVNDISIFDIAVFQQSWGQVAVGPVMSFSTSDNAATDFSIGPAFGFVAPVNKKLNVGLFSQNLFGNDTAISQLQPIIAYQLGDGWSISGGDLQFTYDWQEGRWLNIPVGFQLGKVLTLGDQPCRIAVNPQYNFADDGVFPEWKVTLTFTLLVPSR